MPQYYKAYSQYLNEYKSNLDLLNEILDRYNEAGHSNKKQAAYLKISVRTLYKYKKAIKENKEIHNTKDIRTKAKNRKINLKENYNTNDTTGVTLNKIEQSHIELIKQAEKNYTKVQVILKLQLKHSEGGHTFYISRIFSEVTEADILTLVYSLLSDLTDNYAEYYNMPELKILTMRYKFIYEKHEKTTKNKPKKSRKHKK